MSQAEDNLISFIVSDSTGTDVLHSISFFLAQKVDTIRPAINVGWIKAECQKSASFLDTHMYLAFAENCLNSRKTRRGYSNI